MGEEVKYGLETRQAERPVWLMKCPPVISRSWKKHAAEAPSPSLGPNPNPRPLVAKVILSIDPFRADDPNAVEFTMEMAETESENVPKTYPLKMSKDSSKEDSKTQPFVPMCIFSESNQGKLALEGRVEKKFEIEFHSQNLSNYGKLCRERTNKYMVKSRQVQVLSKEHGHIMPMPGVIQPIFKDKKRPAPVKPSDVKRTRRDRREVENIIFKLFERQPHWSLKQLVIETDQPEQFLKEILNDLCCYNKRGPHQGTHELKPEYKKSTDDAEAS